MGKRTKDVIPYGTGKGLVPLVRNPGQPRRHNPFHTPDTVEEEVEVEVTDGDANVV